jgi:hypothetical protein
MIKDTDGFDGADNAINYPFHMKRDLQNIWHVFKFIYIYFMPVQNSNFYLIFIGGNSSQGTPKMVLVASLRVEPLEGSSFYSQIVSWSVSWEEG